MSPQIAVIPHKARATGLHFVATKGSGKSRTLGRVIAYSDVESGFPVALLDPVGATIDNLLDKFLRLSQSDQAGLRLRERVVYVDVGGRDSGGHVCPWPLLYRLRPNDALYDVAMRPLSVWIKTDKDLARAPLMGANALTKVGLHTGMLLAGLGMQLTEADSLLTDPGAWAGRIRHALEVNPSELTSAGAYFLQEYPSLPARERQAQTASFRQKLGMFADPTLRAIHGADCPGIDWDDVVTNRKVVLLDFRNVPEHRKKFAVVWVHSTLLEWIRRRGPGRHRPLSLIVDEATYLLSDASVRDDPLADDLEELIDRLSRNTQTWCTYAHQEMSQLSPKAANLFMKGLASQLLGRTADPDAAELYARRFYRWNPHWVRKTIEQYHPPTAFASSWTDIRTEEYTRDDQTDLNARRFFDLPTFSFYLGVAPREGELPTSLRRISVAAYDAEQYVQEEFVAHARALLMQRHPSINEILTSIAQRQHAAIPIVPGTLTDGSVRDVIHSGHNGVNMGIRDSGVIPSVFTDGEPSTWLPDQAQTPPLPLKRKVRATP